MIWIVRAGSERLVVRLGVVCVACAVGANRGVDELEADVLAHDKVERLEPVVGGPVEVAREFVSGAKNVEVEVGLAFGGSEKPFFAVRESV